MEFAFDPKILSIIVFHKDNFLHFAGGQIKISFNRGKIGEEELVKPDEI
jgi:hypothetical protein